MPRDEFVQPIVLLVDKVDPADEVDAIRATAIASITAYGKDLADGAPTLAWDAWLDGPFAKSVRRADRKTFEKVRAEYPDAIHVPIGLAEALAFRPLPADQMPRTLSRLQVSGTQLPNERETSPAVPNTPTVFLNADLGMSTGKAAAQAAHALFLWSLQAGDLITAYSEGIDCEVKIVGKQEFDEIIDRCRPEAVITDAGRTEIEPGSVTAFAI